MEDELLNQLALEAKQLPPGIQKQKVLTQLLSRILRSHRLARPQQGRWPAQLYEEIWNDACSKTLLEVAQRIDSYKPEHAVLAWVNSILKYRFQDVVQDYCYKDGMTGVPRQGVKQEEVRFRLLDELENNCATESDDFQLLHQFIREDPEGLLTKTIRGRPEATFQFLLLALLSDQTWDEISAILGPPPISKQTLSSFFNRQLRTLTPYFLKRLSD